MVRWKGYGPEWDEWYKGYVEDLLDHAMELVKAYGKENQAEIS